MYIGFLLSEPRYSSCCRLSDVIGISHDSVNRFLLRETYTPQDLFDEVKSGLNLVGGTVSVDDSVLDKPYSQRMALVGHFWSGKHHRVVKGMNLITLYYTDIHDQHQPVNYRLYDKAEGKTKNDYVLEMLAEVLAWGLKPAFVTGDSWYSSVKNLKTVKHHGLGFLFGLESNRLVSVEHGHWAQVQHLDIPETGQVVWLRQFGYVKVFRQPLKDQQRHYAVYMPEETSLTAFEQKAFLHLHGQHWRIEEYHRTLKQVCHIEHFHVRTHVAIQNHVFAAICGYAQLQRLRALDMISNCYRLQRDLFNPVIASFIRSFMPGKEHLNPQFHQTVNA